MTGNNTRQCIGEWSGVIPVCTVIGNWFSAHLLLIYLKKYWFIGWMFLIPCLFASLFTTVTILSLKRLIEISFAMCYEIISLYEHINGFVISLQSYHLCLLSDCEKPSPIKNGNFTLHHELTTFGATVTYQCNTGYVLDGSFARTCDFKNDKAAWSFLSPTCIPLGREKFHYFFKSSINNRIKLVNYF